ncbi:MAG: type IV secretory system conjugative DNA transfer family protein [Actinobacteria bacterium]|nr:type IV secretory system conjugative DNA transfer family protein [Actinomycetota bacterium]
MGFSPGEGLAVAALLVLGALTTWLWAGTHVAARLAGHEEFSGGWSEAAVAVVRMPSHLDDPGAAWGPAGGAFLPAAPLAYAGLGVAALPAVGVGLGAVHLRQRVRARQHPLGVVPRAGLARRADLGALAVDAPEPGRLTLGWNGRRLVAAEGQASLAVVGPTGCGKTAGLAVPALLEWEGPVIATSVKTDLLAATLASRRARGKVWVYDPTGCSGVPAATWSPLPACRTWRGAMRMAAGLSEASAPRLDTVTDGDYWLAQARKALAPLLLAAATGVVRAVDGEVFGYTLADIVRWVDEQNEGEVRQALLEYAGVPEAVEDLLASPEFVTLAERLRPETREQIIEAFRAMMQVPDSPHHRLARAPVHAWPLDLQRSVEERVEAEVDDKVRGVAEVRAEEEAVRTGRYAPLAAIEALWARDERLRGSVYATLQIVLLAFSDPDVLAAAEGSEIEPGALLSGPNTLLVIAPSHEQARLRPVLTVLVQQVIRAAYERANREGGTLSKPCLVLLDEAANIAPLRQLPEYAATARSHGISLVSVWQDLAQIQAIYGDRAHTVLNNHRAKIFGSGIADLGTLQYVSALVGETEEHEWNANVDLGPGARRSLLERTHREPTLPVEVVRRMLAAEGLLIYGAHLPVRLRLRLWHESPELRALAGAPPQGPGRQAGTVRRPRGDYRKRHSL